MKLTKSRLAHMSKSYAKATTQHVAQRAVTNMGIMNSAEDVSVAMRLSPPNFAFSIDVDKQAVANQKASGRCWMFACLNTLRFHIERELRLPKGTFELSQAFPVFYNKLERAAWFLEHVKATADKPLDDREVSWLFETPMADGGDWDMICGLVMKYGLVPHQAMSETQVSNDTAMLNRLLSRLLRKDGLELRELVQTKKDTTGAIERMLDEVYRMLAVCYGEPPERFTFQFEDIDGIYHIIENITPLDFFHEFVPIDLTNYVGVINVPGEDRPFNRLYTVADSDQIPERRNLYLNVSMDDLKDLVIRQLMADMPVWFGCDVLQHCDEERGVMSHELFDYESLFNVSFTMDKQQRYDTFESAPTHAMVIAGVDIVDGKPSKWKIENSWGVENHGFPTGNNGYFVCDDQWFDDYVFEVAIDKQFMTPEQRVALDTEPITWPYWSTFNPVVKFRA